MAIELIVKPVYQLRCDRYPVCKQTVRGETEYTVRSVAERRHGWQVRPGHGKGKFTAPDLCPIHKDGM